MIDLLRKGRKGAGRATKKNQEKQALAGRGITSRPPWLLPRASSSVFVTSCKHHRMTMETRPGGDCWVRDEMLAIMRRASRASYCLSSALARSDLLICRRCIPLTITRLPRFCCISTETHQRLLTSASQAAKATAPSSSLHITVVCFRELSGKPEMHCRWVCNAEVN
jgi:hypothetical protein